MNKEREAFDAYFKDKYPELYKDVFNEDGDDRAIIGYSFAWSAWQAKAKAVQASINDIQSWIAVNSFSDLDVVHDNVQIVDANELAKYIDSLSLSVSVPEGFVLVPKEPTPKMIDAGYMVQGDTYGEMGKIYKAMIEAAQEQSHDS